MIQCIILIIKIEANISDDPKIFISLINYIYP